jgi:hypothetical protein
MLEKCGFQYKTREYISWQRESIQNLEYTLPRVLDYIDKMAFNVKLYNDWNKIKNITIALVLYLLKCWHLAHLTASISFVHLYKSLK